MKEQFRPQAEAIFADAEVKIMCEGQPHLGAPLGTIGYTCITKFISEKVAQWSQELTILSAIAMTQPHDAFSAYTHGLYGKWSYLTRTVPSISHHLEPLDNLVRIQLVPHLTVHPLPGDLEMNLMSLPGRFGSLGIAMPSLQSNDFNASLKVTAPYEK